MADLDTADERDRYLRLLAVALPKHSEEENTRHERLLELLELLISCDNAADQTLAAWLRDEL
jgi:hypothetical protein